ncbi:uncharacterized protein LOC122666882 [Telopea speciosissima]|uniref:uncharacterized protein LOC122666882 n=1 Tax=Telopea speciosissima TaxID=54955 RepID=UPI001CC573C4|nr:uncharacterized protein LOC122666882 [Telopea speciosissima]
MTMEKWVPLFDIFLNSPSPEGEASLWLQQSFDASAPTSTITANSFLSLLSKPCDTTVIDPSPSSSAPSSSFPSKRVMWIQTLPNAIQSRILSFLAVENRRFCARDLTALATNILEGHSELDFWVKRAALNLLDSITSLNSCSSSYSVSDTLEEKEFRALPDWLQDMTNATGSLLPWLPLSPAELNSTTLSRCSADGSPNQDEDSFIKVDERMEEDGSNAIQSSAGIKLVSPADAPLDPEIQKRAAFFKARLLNFESTSKTVNLANEIRQLYFDQGGGRVSLTVLGIIEPWEADEETASILLSHLSKGVDEDFAWSGQVLCSVVLPKLLVINEPASRVLVTATIEYCKLHQRAAVDALLFPLILCKEGINSPICDVVTRIIRECLHPAHVSAVCQKLLCREEDARQFVCLPCHRSLISNKLVWTEPLFTFFQNILNHNVHLTQDSVNHLVSVVGELADGFSNSLKFGNFLLCLVTKCAHLLKSHKVLLIEAVECTNTFMTKSILSKLAGL